MGGNRSKLAIVGLVVVGAVAWAIGNDNDNEITPEEHAANLEAVLGPDEPIEYVVTGTASNVSLTYTNHRGDTEQVDPARTRQTIEMTGIPSGQFLYISVQNNDATGRVGCEIRTGDRVLAEADSTGGYAIATCDASAP